MGAKNSELEDRLAAAIPTMARLITPISIFDTPVADEVGAIAFKCILAVVENTGRDFSVKCVEWTRSATAKVEAGAKAVMAFRKSADSAGVEIGSVFPIPEFLLLVH